VFGPLWQSVPLALAKYARALVLGKEPPQSLADTSPLTAALEDPQLLDWQKVRENISAGLLDALAFAATETGSGRTKLFYQTKRGFDPGVAQSSGETQAIDYVDTQLGAEHVRASAAIPVLFPPVMIASEAGAKSFFIDGGIRLNAPLKPALKLGAKGIVVVSTDPRHFGTSLTVEPKSPTMQGQVLQVLRALFADRMIEDIRVLLNRNRKRAEQLLNAAAANDTGRGSEDRIVPIIFGGPIDHDRLGGIAARAVEELLRGAPFVRLFKNFDVTLLHWLTSVSATSGPDLMSYIMFEPQFIELALKAGIQDASALLNDYPEPNDLWQALAARDSRHRPPEQGASTSPLSPPAAA
jgi:NTE family protein